MLILRINLAPADSINFTYDAARYKQFPPQFPAVEVDGCVNRATMGLSLISATECPKKSSKREATTINCVIFQQNRVLTKERYAIRNALSFILLTWTTNFGLDKNPSIKV